MDGGKFPAKFGCYACTQADSFARYGCRELAVWSAHTTTQSLLPTEFQCMVRGKSKAREKVPLGGEKMHRIERDAPPNSTRCSQVPRRPHRDRWRSKRLLVAGICCILSVLAFAPTTVADDPLRVFILAGQSNMVGGGLLGELPPSLDSLQTDVLYSWRLRTTQTVASDEWVALQHYASAPPAGVSYGPELSFGRQLADALPDQIAILKLAANGTNLHTDWDPTTGDVYEQMFAYADAALAQLVADGMTPSVAGLIWVQGTSDAGTIANATNYEANLNDLIAAVRQRFTDSDLPLVFNLYHEDSVFFDAISPEEIAALRQSQRNVAAGDPSAWLIEADDTDLRSVGDVHYTGEAFVTLGRRLADAYLSGVDAFSVADFNFDGLVDGDDVARWQATFPSAAQATRVDGDANADGRVDGLDFLMLQQQFTRSGNLATAVPEPDSAAMIAGMGFAMLTAARRRLSRRRAPSSCPTRSAN